MTDTRAKSFSAQWGTRLRALRNLPAVLLVVWESGPKVVTAAITLRIVSALLPLAMLAISRWIVDALAALGRGQALPHNFWLWVALEFCLATILAMLGRTLGFLESLVADNFSRDLSLRVMQHASRLDLLSYEDPVFYDKLERARSEATDRIAMIQMTGSVFQQSILALSFCVTLLWYAPWALAILVLCVIPALASESHFAFLGYSLNFSQTPMRREIEYLRYLGASRDSAKELRLFGLAPYFFKRFRHLSQKIYLQNFALSRRRLVAGVLLSTLTSIGYYSAYLWVVWWAATGRISLGTMTFLSGAIAGARDSIQSVFAMTSSVADQALFLVDLIEFFKVKPTVTSKPNAIPIPKPIREGFRFENVSFAYPGSQRKILDGLNLAIAPGERLALVGANGEGKTTIVKLLTRLYDPTEGRILLDGIDLRDYDLDSLTREIGAIFQDFMRYDMTAKQNIVVGNVERLREPAIEDTIRTAAEKSLASEVLARMPAGLNQMLGRRFENGQDLSGGEWQKLALARAYLRDAQLVILDEPTASLDAQSELDVFERFTELSTGRMALIISHRFSTVRGADRIIVLSKGQIIEEGTHTELLAADGPYSKMFNMQAASYVQ